MLSRLTFATCLIALSGLVSAAPSQTAKREIQGLMDALSASSCEFHRNGTWHGREEARRHLQRKYEYLLKRDLADTADVRDSRGVSGVGEQAYVVYTVDTHDRIGEAVANARLANVLVTVHYSGGDDRDTKGRPLSASNATNGALSAARDIIAKLESHS